MPSKNVREGVRPAAHSRCSKYVVAAAADTRLGCYVQFFFLNILLAALSFRTACMKFFSDDINDCIATVRCIENQSRLYTSPQWFD